MNNIDKFKDFTNGEIYVLQRQAIEGSANIMLSGNMYDDWVKQTHRNLLNEILDEAKRRRL